MARRKLLKRGQFKFESDRPMQLLTDLGPQRVDEPTKALIDRVGTTLKAYLAAATELLNGKYQQVRHLAPAHLANPGNVLAASCPDGLVIRFETAPEDSTEKPKVYSGWTGDSLKETALMLSQQLIHLWEEESSPETLPYTGPEILLSAIDPATGQQNIMFRTKVGIAAVLKPPTSMPEPPQKPFCLISIRNQFKMSVLGAFIDEGNNPSLGGKPFVLRSTLRLPMGWDCIEVYPFFNIAQWDPAWASNWVEHDILAAVVARQAEESEFASLDPNVTARRQFGLLLKEYKELLDSPPRNEEVLQAFMRDHPMLLCPSYVNVWPKLPLGSRQTDFVFQQATGDYLLVELEAASRQIFRQDGHPASALTHAQGQITDWKRYLEDNRRYVESELGLPGISTNPDTLIVIGRSASLNQDNRRKLVTMRNSSPKDKVLTYDDVYDNAKAVIENLFGPLWDLAGNAEVYYPPVATWPALTGLPSESESERQAPPG